MPPSRRVHGKLSSQSWVTIEYTSFPCILLKRSTYNYYICTYSYITAVYVQYIRVSVHHRDIQYIYTYTYVRTSDNIVILQLYIHTHMCISAHVHTVCEITLQLCKYTSKQIRRTMGHHLNVFVWFGRQDTTKVWIPYLTSRV